MEFSRISVALDVLSVCCAEEVCCHRHLAAFLVAKRRKKGSVDCFQRSSFLEAMKYRVCYGLLVKGGTERANNTLGCEFVCAITYCLVDKI